jgi:hypothetical protein
MSRWDKCQYPKCRRDSELVYLDKRVCWKHWQMIDERPNLLRKKLGLPPMEVPKPKPKIPTISIFTGRVRVRRNHG